MYNTATYIITAIIYNVFLIFVLNISDINLARWLNDTQTRHCF